ALGLKKPPSLAASFLEIPPILKRRRIYLQPRTQLALHDPPPEIAERPRYPVHGPRGTDLLRPHHRPSRVSRSHVRARVVARSAWRQHPSLWFSLLFDFSGPISCWALCPPVVALPLTHPPPP